MTLFSFKVLIMFKVVDLYLKVTIHIFEYLGHCLFLCAAYMEY